eukprot:3366068-Rhodomonas_salina.2
MHSSCTFVVPPGPSYVAPPVLKPPKQTNVWKPGTKAGGTKPYLAMRLLRHVRLGAAGVSGAAAGRARVHARQRPGPRGRDAHGSGGA